MGDPKKSKKRYDTPRKPFEKERIEAEREQTKTYGLKNKREIYNADTMIRKKRATAKKLLAHDLETRLKREKELLDSLKKLGILTGEPSLEDVLTLTEETLLERRLQTIVLRKGLANTAKQARQFIVHGHIAVDGKKVDRPSYLVTPELEGKITYYGKEMQLIQKEVKPKKETKETSELKTKFEEARPKEQKEEPPKEEKTGKKAAPKKESKEKQKEETKEPAKKEEAKVNG